MLQEIISYLQSSYQINPLWQIIGLIWFLMWIVAFWNKNDAKAKTIHGFSLFIWSLHYFLIWLYAGVASDLLGGFRNLLSVKYRKNKKVVVSVLFLYIVFLWLTYENTFSILPILSWIIVTLSFFYLKWIKMRLVLIMCSFFWLVYNFYWRSIWWIVIELFLISINTVTIIRLVLDNKKAISIDTLDYSWERV